MMVGRWMVNVQYESQWLPELGEKEKKIIQSVNTHTHTHANG